MAGSQDLFVPLGFDEGQATDMSKQITKLAVDLASFNNMQDKDTLRDLHAALTGSGEVMKKYGVLVQEAQVKQELLNQGMDPKTATTQQKVMARLNIIMRGTTAAQGDAIRSAGSFANQMKAAKAAVLDAAASIGQVLLPIVTPMVTTFAKWIEAIGQIAMKNQGLVKTLAAITVGAIGAGAAFVALGAVITGVGATLGVITSAPILALGAAVGGLVFIFRDTFGYFLDLGNHAYKGIVDLFAQGKIEEGLKASFAVIKTLFKGVVLEIKLKWLQFTNFFKGVWVTAVNTLAKSLVSVFFFFERTFHKNQAMMAKGIAWLAGKAAAVTEKLKMSGTAAWLRDVEDSLLGRAASSDRKASESKETGIGAVKLLDDDLTRELTSAFQQLTFPRVVGTLISETSFWDTWPQVVIEFRVRATVH